MLEAPEIIRRRLHRRNLAQRIRDLRRQLFTTSRGELNTLARLIIKTEQAGSVRPETVQAEAAELLATAIYTLNNARWHEEHRTGVIVNTRVAEEQRKTAEELSVWAAAQLQRSA